MRTADRRDLSEADLAFPETRQEPIDDAAHVRNAIARFDQVKGVTDRSEIAPGRGSRRPQTGMA
jgi:hypothetical protein